MFPFKSAIAVGIVLILVGAAILWGKSVVTTVTGLFKPSATVVEAPKDTSTPLAKPKIPDRVGQPSSTDQVAPVAQRVVLYDEDPSDPKGKQYVGSVVWRTEPIKAAAGQKADIAVRADIEIPDRKFKMTMSFRRNTDTSLPASHTAELTFTLPPDFAGGGVGNVPGILMKSNEQARGTPLAGPRGQGHRRLLPGRPVECRCRPRAQPAAPEGALLVRRAAGLRQPAPRHHRDRKRPAGRTRVQRRIRGVGRVEREGRSFGAEAMRFSWTALIVAPLLVPLLFSLAMVGFSESGNPLLMFLILMVPGCVISYGTTIFLLLPALYLVSRWRPLTGLNVCLLGLVLGMLVFVPLTWIDWASSGPDSGPPTESFLSFFLRWAADPVNAIYPVAGLITAGLYWWLATQRSGHVASDLTAPSA